MRVERPSPRVTIAQVVAGLSPGAIDGRCALTRIDASHAETAYDLHRQAMAPSADGPWDESERRGDFNQLLARVPSFFIEIDDTISGYLQVLPRREILHVVNIGLAVACRGQGHGTTLMRWLQAEACVLACGLHLKTYRTNPRALVFYRRCGFIQSHRDAHHWWLDWWPAGGGPTVQPRRK